MSVKYGTAICWFYPDRGYLTLYPDRAVSRPTRSRRIDDRGAATLEGAFQRTLESIAADEIAEYRAAESQDSTRGPGASMGAARRA